MTTITTRPAPTPRHGFTATAAILAVLALAAPSTPAAAGHNTEADVPPPCGPLAVNQPIQLPAGTTAAGPILRRLAAHLRAEPADAQNGRYTHFAVTMTAADSSIGDCVTTETRFAAERRWRDERANSGRITGTPWYSNPGPAPAVVTTWYQPGDLPGVLPGYAPSDPAVLAAALDEAYPPDTDRLAAKVRVEELLAERGIEVDHVTIYRWAQRFTPLLADVARFARHSPGDRWYVDEIYVKVNGVWRYVYRAVDQHGQVSTCCSPSTETPWRPAGSSPGRCAR